METNTSLLSVVMDAASIKVHRALDVNRSSLLLHSDTTTVVCLPQEAENGHKFFRAFCNAAESLTECTSVIVAFVLNSSELCHSLLDALSVMPVIDTLTFIFEPSLQCVDIIEARLSKRIHVLGSVPQPRR